MDLYDTVMLMNPAICCPLLTSLAQLWLTDKLLWILTPRSFSYSTLSSLWFPIVYTACWFLGPMCMILNFLTLNSICHLLAQFVEMSRSLCSTLLSSYPLALWHNLVSSANLSTVDCMSLSRSLIYMRNKSTPRIKPCGTPLVTVVHSDISPLTTTRCCRSLNHAAIHSVTCSCMPMDLIFSRRSSRGTLSNAFAKSRYAMSMLLYLSISYVTVSINSSKSMGHHQCYINWYSAPHQSYIHTFMRIR